MSDVTITLPDGSTRSVAAGTSVRDVAAAISPRLAKAALAAAVDDRLVDLAFPLDKDAKVRLITPDSPEGLTIYRHSTAHLLAAAVTNLFPGVAVRHRPSDRRRVSSTTSSCRARSFPKTSRPSSKKMREMAQQDLPYERQMWPREEARQFFGSRGEPLKVQLIDEKTEGQEEVSCYTIKDRETFVDFCVGPHVPSTGRLKAFKLLSTSNAYWKGDARNQPMQRVYGTAFFSDKDLQAVPAPPRGSEEARPSEDRPRSEAVHVSPVGAGRHVLARQRHHALEYACRATCAACSFPAGYVEVKTPLVYNKDALGNVGALVPLSRRTCSSSNRPMASRWASKR